MRIGTFETNKKRFTKKESFKTKAYQSATECSESYAWLQRWEREASDAEQPIKKLSIYHLIKKKLFIAEPLHQ